MHLFPVDMAVILYVPISCSQKIYSDSYGGEKMGVFHMKQARC